MQITKDNTHQVLKLAGKLDIDRAGDLRTALADFLNEGASLIVDLSGVSECDTTVLQLLYSACRTAERAGNRLTLAEPSDAILDTSAALGLVLVEPPSDAA